MSDTRGAIDVSAHWDGAQVNIVASSNGLSQLIRIIRNEAFGGYKLINRTTHTDSTRFSTIEIFMDNDLLAMRVADNTISLRGSERFLSIFAINMERLMSSWEKGMFEHCHNDPISNPFLISPDSESFIICFGTDQ